MSGVEIWLSCRRPPPRFVIRSKRPFEFFLHFPDRIPSLENRFEKHPLVHLIERNVARVREMGFGNGGGDFDLGAAFHHGVFDIAEARPRGLRGRRLRFRLLVSLDRGVKGIPMPASRFGRIERSFRQRGDFMFGNPGAMPPAGFKEKPNHHQKDFRPKMAGRQAVF
ncbi:hypothetical protein [Aureimonas sp. N4]|uniref:hypothetical protein n=1 Tax=Aureimonas sp. N4 TaxID=1638165 RepID=UPI0012E3D892|nr:hypothetical protein [Aureimonas sp. N4]